MKNSIGFLGIGQAGSNITLGFERLGYSTAYLNTSKEDLDSLTYAKHKIHILGGEGASKNRKAVLQLAAESIDDIINDVLSVLTQDYIMIVFSAGGGTGSGLGPVLASYLSHIGRKVIYATILPSKKESPKTCENAYNTCVDISNIESLGAVFLLDNDRHEDKFAINDIFVKDIDALINLNNCSKFGNIDKSEIKTLLSTQGISIITRHSKAKSTAPFIIQSFAENIYASIEEKTPVVVGISTTNKSLNFDDIYCEIGYPYDDFRGISNANTLCMASGYPWPLKRIEALKEQASRVTVHRNTLGLSKIGEQILAPISTAAHTNNINTRDLILNFLNN